MLTAFLSNPKQSLVLALVIFPEYVFLLSLLSVLFLLRSAFDRLLHLLLLLFLNWHSSSYVLNIQKFYSLNIFLLIYLLRLFLFSLLPPKLLTLLSTYPQIFLAFFLSNLLTAKLHFHKGTHIPTSYAQIYSDFI